MNWLRRVFGRETADGPVNVDLIRMRYTYRLATLVLTGLFALLLIDTPGITGGEKLAFVSGAATSVFLFAFKREEQVGTARATERAAAQGAAMAGTGTTVTNAETVQSGGPTTVTETK